MKAAVCYEFGNPLVIEDLELSPPQFGEIKVKLAACAICHSDIHYAEGAWGGNPPMVLGHEAAGIVETVADGVTGVKEGDHVIVTLIRHCGSCYYCAQGNQVLCETSFPLDANSPLKNSQGEEVAQAIRTGAFAEYVVVDQSQVIPIPKDVPLDAASLLACGVVTGLGAVTHTAQMPTGSSAVVIGTGGVGLNSIQGAALSGGQLIIAMDLVAAKLETAKTFGATHTINPNQEDAKAKVLELTDGRGVDYVFATVGSTKAMQQGIDLLAPAGTLVIVGMPPSGETVDIEAVNLAHSAQKIMGSKMGSIRPKVDIPKLVKLYKQGRLKLGELISGRYPLENINEAIAEVNRGEALRNVIVF